MSIAVPVDDFFGNQTCIGQLNCMCWTYHRSRVSSRLASMHLIDVSRENFVSSLSFTYPLSFRANVRKRRGICIDWFCWFKIFQDCEPHSVSDLVSNRLIQFESSLEKCFNILFTSFCTKEKRRLFRWIHLFIHISKDSFIKLCNPKVI